MKNISSSWMCFVLVVLTTSAAHAQFTVDHQVTIRPIRISDGTTTMGPSSDSALRSAFGDAANKIWAQAGIDIHFLPLETVTSSTFYNVTSGTGNNSISSLSSASGLGQSTDIHVINLWFVNQINSSANILGVTLQSIPTDGTFTLTQNGIVIANVALTRNEGKSASDTIAHEIGHSLGLNHTAFGAVGQLNLMSSTTYPPRGMSDIFPDGGEYDQLTQAQISQARGVTFFVRPIAPFKYPPELPVIKEQPTSVAGIIGGEATFSIGAIGANLTYQWNKDGKALSGETRSLLALKNLQREQAGGYSVTVFQGTDSVVSDTATLTIVGAIPILSNSQFSVLSGFRFTDTHDGEACTIEVSNDLEIWTPYFVYPSAVAGFDFLDPNSTNQSMRFYRVRIP